MNLELEVIHSGTSDVSKTYRKLFNSAGGTLGREPSCDMFLPCEAKTVSRVHAKVLFEKNQFILVDSSANGLFINKAEDPLGHNNRYTLKHGDLIKIGDYELLASLTRIDTNKVGQSKSGNLMPKRDENFASINTHDNNAYIESDLSFNRAFIVTKGGSASSSSKSKASEVRPEIKKSFMDMGSASDHFVPPNTIIPQDWDFETNVQTGSTPSKKKDTVKGAVIQFTNQQNKLIERLIQGLGGEKHLTAEQMTPETMLVIGRALRVAINGIIANRKLLQETKSSLCLDEITIERQMEADALSDIGSSDQFISLLLDPHNRMQSSLPQSLATSYKHSIEDQRDVFSGIQYAIEKLKEGLSPQAIEAAYTNAQQLDEKSAQPIVQLSNKFSANAKRWAFYRKNWGKLCGSITTQIRKNFESKILLSHARRMRDKNHGSK